jgi:hypothetical protein
MQRITTRAADSVCSLPRLRGRGGEGAPCTVYLCACPLPIPPPQAGEGTDRVRGVVMHPEQIGML